MNPMSEKVLFVDDEPVLLQGYQRLLRKEFEVTTRWVARLR